MADSDSSPLYVMDAAGNPVAVQLPLPLWQAVRKHVQDAQRRMHQDNPLERPEPLEDFRQFLDYWDFKYPYSPDVRCLHCGAATDDWQADPDHPFHLTNANLGGLLVFRCKHCGSTVRRKHFRDHSVFEVTPVNS